VSIAGSASSEDAGFTGTVVCSILAEAVQLQAQARISGRLRVLHSGEEGRIYFRKGEIIHAETAGESGEAAFTQILSWPGGRFTFEPHISTTSQSIRKKWQHVLLEACRFTDERVRAQVNEGPPSAERTALLEAVNQLKDMRGVRCAIGQLGYAGPLHDDSPGASVLGTDARYLAFLGKQLGALFGGGTVLSASVTGGTPELRLFVVREASLALLLDPGTLPALSPRLHGLLASLGFSRGGALQMWRGARSPAWRGGLKCDRQGRVLKSTLSGQGERAAREAGLIIADALTTLGAAHPENALLALECEHAELEVKASSAGFWLRWEIASSNRGLGEAGREADGEVRGCPPSPVRADGTGTS